MKHIIPFAPLLFVVALVWISLTPPQQQALVSFFDTTACKLMMAASAVIVILVILARTSVLGGNAHPKKMFH